MKGFQRFNKYIILSLFVILVGVLVLDFNFSQIQAPRVLGDATVSFPDYPVVKTSVWPSISAKGAVIIDADSKAVLYSKNESLRFSTASTSKIMTALTALEYFGLNDILTVKKATSEGSILGLKEGEKISFENLLYGMLLPSANDAAFAVAQNYPSDFVRAMNKNAVKFNLYNTHFEDPAGLLDDQDYTTPLDLGRLAAVAIKNPEFVKIVSTKEKTIMDESGKEYRLKNLNKLLGVDGIFGIKTGTTEAAGEVLVTSKKMGEHTIIIVVMGSEGRFQDTEKLLRTINGNITYSPIRP